MQVKNIHSIEFLKKKNGVFAAAKILISVFCLYFLFTQFREKDIVFSSVSLPKYFYQVLVLQVLLMVFNWYLEALRWRASFRSTERITIGKALTEVLSGLAMNWVLPATFGDFLARVISKRDKYKATSAIFLNRMMMMGLTSIFGIFGALHYADLKFEVKYEFLLFPLLGFALFLALRKYLTKFITYFKELDRKTYWAVTLLSVVRYSVFTMQYLILLSLFLPSLSTKMILAGVGWIFVARSVVPSFLGGIGVREASALLFYEGLVSDLSMVIIPVFFLWLLNTVFPSLVGLILIWKLRIKIAE